MDDKDFIRDYLDSRYKRLNNIPRYVGEVVGTYPDNILLITMNGMVLTVQQLQENCVIQ